AEPAKLTSLAERYEGLRVTTEEVKGGAQTNQEPVAIIGMSGMFPQSKDLEEFWKYLETETDLISEVPIERWDWRDYHIDYVAPSSKIKTRSKWGGYLPEVDKFDPRFFHISPLEAEMMDPQQRLFLETVWKTIEDGGYKPSDFSGRRVGLFAGIQFSDYQQLLASQGELNAQMGLGNEHSIFVNRISYLLNLHGPSEPYNTACSSSGVAIHRAVRAIRGGECELAIAGGISLMLSPYTMISSDQLGILSPDGRCKTLDKSANGYVKGEGVGALLLKPLGKAMEDRDHIYAVIKGTAVNHGGKAASLTAPNAEAQAELLVDAYQDADMDPSTVSYLELHGTGTELGDPVEIEGIKKAFAVLAKRREKVINRYSYCGIGSVKTNIGHLEPASGIAGMMKVILSMKHEKLPGILHLNELNPYVQIKNTPLYIVERTKRWDRLTDDQGREIPRRAGVSSFGFGGVNSHIVLEEYTPHITRTASEKQRPLIFVLSAKNQDRLRVYVQSMLDFLEKGDHPSLVDLVYTLQVGREEWNERLACVVSDIDGLIRQLQSYLQNKPAREGIYTGTVKKKQAETEIDLAVDTPHSIAERWVNGSPVAWDQLYAEKPYRLSLPTYPFARERYWAVKGNKPNVIPTQFATAKEHLSERAGNEGKPANFFDVLPGSSSEVAVALPDIAQPGVETAGYVDELKRMLAGILKLDSDEIEADKDFTEYGVDSIVSSVIVQQVQEQYSISIQLSAVVEYPTLAEFAAFVADEVTSQRPGAATVAKTVKVQPTRQTAAKLPPELIPLNLGGHYHNSFWVHGGPGLAAFYTSLSQALGKDYPFYVFQAKGVDGKTMPRDFEEMVTHYMHCIRMVQPKGPYVIGGYSFGGLVAYEMAQRFILEGEKMAHLVIFDTFPCDPEANAIFYSNSDPHNAFFKLMMGNEFANARKNRTALILPKDLDGVHPYLHIAHIAKLAKERGKSPLNTEDIYNYIAGACRLNDYAGSTYDSYRPQPYSGSDVLYFKATDGFVGKDNWMGLDPYHVYGSYDYTGPWRKLVKGNLNIVEVPCDHFNILEEPSLSIVTKSVRSILS
ncbi:MAG TPA: beta-ketoacyl synthase N-terminal-like domain-containing protein, partial [Brevibacillus sp.]|nr:beta-ketoacyl synthase N-terminal-like domain-containing protein [Brevibacillus sp.]